MITQTKQSEQQQIFFVTAMQWKLISKAYGHDLTFLSSLREPCLYNNELWAQALLFLDYMTTDTQ